MAGSPTCGKMSTGMRSMARIAQSATARSANTTVTGRESEPKTKRMDSRFPGASSPRLGQEGPDIARRRRDGEQPAPDAQPGQCVVDLRLRQQALGVGDFGDVS